MFLLKAAGGRKYGTVHLSVPDGKGKSSTEEDRNGIPRLELAAAAVAVKIADVLKKELNYDNLEEYYWPYVANKVQLIQDYTSQSQWKYVSSAENPADRRIQYMV